MIAKATIDTKRYARLLGKVAPTVISSEKEYERLMREFDKLFNKEELTPEEDALFDLLVVLIEKFEKEKYYESSATSLDILKLLMEEHSKQPKDLWNLFGSKGRVSEVLSGKRVITKLQAKALAEYFHVSPALFLDLDK